MRRTLEPSLRLLIAAVVATPVILLAIVLVTLAVVMSRGIAEDLGSSVVNAATASVQGQVQSYLGDAVRVSDLYARRIESGDLPTAGLTAWERLMLDDLVTSPDVASICFGNAAGEATWLLRNRERLEIGRAAASDDASVNNAVEFAASVSGEIDLASPLRNYHYDPRERPWYAAAVNAASPRWTDAYFWFGESGGESETGTGYTRAIINADGEVIGALVIDVTLGSLSGFLRTLPLSRVGAVFVVDQQGFLVAASHGPVNSADGHRLGLSQSDEPAAVAAARAGLEMPAESPAASLTAARVFVDDEPARVSVARLAPYPGIDWRVIAVIPESAFMQQARTIRTRSIVAAAVAVLGAVMMGLLLAGRLARPLLQLRAHVKQVGGGDFESRLELSAARELRELSDDLNRMAVDLKTHMELQQAMGVAMQVQQSLLPQQAPELDLLDLAGHSRYCDATGGDYYDFIEMAALEHERVVIAVGDVMGHGIAAALLMATARAALRANASREGSLGLLMSGVNGVLARDARHGRFMTMALAVIDPIDRMLRWASAGHDAPIVFLPGEDRIFEPEGGDVPLGVMDDVVYEEYTLRELPEDAVIVIGTDGIWEARGPEGEMFGKTRLEAIIRAHAHQSAAEILSAVEKTLAAFTGGCAITDDITLVVAKLRKQ